MSSSFSTFEHPGSENAQLFFMHIPKTGGQSLVEVIEKQFEENEIARCLYPFDLTAKPSSYFDERRYLHGHVEYG